MGRFEQSNSVSTQILLYAQKQRNIIIIIIILAILGIELRASQLLGSTQQTWAITQSETDFKWWLDISDKGSLGGWFLGSVVEKKISSI
jgi:hypothetical protein